MQSAKCKVKGWVEGGWGNEANKKGPDFPLLLSEIITTLSLVNFLERKGIIVQPKIKISAIYT